MAKIERVLLIIAMEAEAAPLVNELNLTKDDPPRIAAPAPCVSFSGQYAGMEVHVVCNGKCLVHGVDNVGTVPAALSAYLALQEFKPDLLISVGTAGGFRSKGAEVGDVFVGTATVYHDRRIPIPGFDKYGTSMTDAVPTPNLKAALGLKNGVVSSGNSLDFCSEDMQLMQMHEAAVKEMEAAAIAWSCHLFGCPMFCLKAITDIVDGGRATEEEFLENLHTAAASLQKATPKVLDFIAGKSVAEL